MKSKRLKVGDIVAVKNKETFPCDLLILATSSLAGKLSSSNIFKIDLIFAGKCYVMTANLDGETNLKPKLAVRETRKLINVGLLKNLTGQIECQNPTPDLFSFSGLIQLEREGGAETHPVNLENLGLPGGSFNAKLPPEIQLVAVLRGTQLRNTEYILGLVTFTGPDTKMSQNSKINANKFSSVERTINLCFIAYLLLLLAEV